MFQNSNMGLWVKQTAICNQCCLILQNWCNTIIIILPQVWQKQMRDKKLAALHYFCFNHLASTSRGSNGPSSSCTTSSNRGWTFRAISSTFWFCSGDEHSFLVMGTRRDVSSWQPRRIGIQCVITPLSINIEHQSMTGRNT